jgi:hypothetical protein
MLGDRDLKAVLTTVECEMHQREADIRQGGRISNESTTRLIELREIRWTIRKVLLSRKTEAAKRVVDFARWRNGDGHLTPAEKKTAAALSVRVPPEPPA